MSKKTFLGNKYQIGIALDMWAESSESVYIQKGDVRLIGGILMFANVIQPAGLRKNIVYWAPVDSKYNTKENMNEWIKNL